MFGLIVIPDNDDDKKQSEQRTIIFKKSDYDLDGYEREAKFKDYDLILCEICNQKLSTSSFFCKNCLDKEVTKIVKSHMLYGRCNECFQILSDYNWCLSCIPKRFKRDFDKWTSGNKHIDELIQDGQLSAKDSSNLLEWIPYSRFTDVKYIAEGGFAKVYSAIWIDGYIKDWNQVLNNWNKVEHNCKVAIKVFDSKHIREEFLNEVKSFGLIGKHRGQTIDFYGITQDPITQHYALVLKLKDFNLRSFLNKNCDLNWETKLGIIDHICFGLIIIHDHNLVHKDLHIGNVLITAGDISTNSCISDLGFCKPADEISSSKIYGVMPYMAPEILRGQEYTKASDIYSLGILINEIISIIPPFNKESHDHDLALDICRGRRPEIREGTPECLKELIKKCWDANPDNRPTAEEVKNLIHKFSYELGNFINLSLKTLPFETHPQAIYASRLLNLSNLPEPVNCTNQEEFISTRYIMQAQTGEVKSLKSECLNCEIID